MPSRKLAAFAFVNCIILNLLLAVVDLSPTALDYARAFVLGERPMNDSWGPMRIALRHIRAHPEEPVYTEVFFERQTKFQYAPTSLLFVDAIDRGSARLSGDAALHTIGWIAVLATALFTWLILQGGTLEQPSRREAATLCVVVVAMTLTFYPVVRAWRLGQIQVWINALVPLMVLLWMRGRRSFAGCICGIVCLIKPPLALIGVWSLWRREWHFAAGFAAAVLLGGFASLVAYGLENHWDYLRVLAFISRVGESFHPNQSINGLLHRLLGNGNNLAWDPHSFPPYHTAVHVGTLATGILLVSGALLWRSPPRTEERLADLLLAILAFTMASPIAWEHHYGVLLPIYAVLLPVCARRGAPLLAGLGISYVLTSNFFGVARHLAATPFNVAQSHLFLGACLLGACLVSIRRSPASATRLPAA